MRPTETLKIYYHTEAHGNGGYFIESVFGIGTWAAAECAEDYHSNHDGWECSWPMKFGLSFTEDGPWTWFSIEREVVHRFSVTPVKP